MKPPSYKSFLVRLWRADEAGGSAWRGEVEHIQSGTTVTAHTLEEALNLVRSETLHVPVTAVDVLPGGMEERPPQ